jgi:hypothetical protein
MKIHTALVSRGACKQIIRTFIYAKTYINILRLTINLYERENLIYTIYGSGNVYYGGGYSGVKRKTRLHNIRNL